MNTVLFFGGAVLLYGAWGVLVVLGKADAHEYIVALGAGLSWLATHVTKKSDAPTVEAIAGHAAAAEFLQPGNATAVLTPAPAAAPVQPVSPAPAAPTLQ